MKDTSKNSLSQKANGCALLLALLLGFSNLYHGQVFVDNTTTPEEALAILLGGGVQVSNIQFSGDLDQIGSFEGSTSNLGMDAGVILGSGNVLFAETGADGLGSGGNDEGSGTMGGGNFGSGDPDLEQISGVTTNDACILEFDFIALGEEVRFDYIFGSEEYNEFVCGTVNDAFGFFLSGPGINGPFSNQAINLAIVPDTDIPVTINSVNNGNVGDFGQEANCASYSPDWALNSQYFVDNATGNTPDMVQYDGFTVMLEAQAAVQCGESYHIKIAVADGGDTGYDSAVFLRQGSFDSPGIVISANLTNTISDDTIHENCGGGTITFERVGNVSQPYTLEISYSGSADSNLDFSGLPTEITFEAGEAAVSIDVVPVQDEELEGVEELIIEVTSSGCNGETTTFSLFITDEELEASLEAEVPYCPGDDVLLDPVVSGGVEPYIFAWSTGDAEESIVVNFETSTLVSLSVVDACGTEEVLNYLVEIPAPAPLAVDFEEIEALDCPGSQSLQPLVGGGTLPYSFTWVEDANPIAFEQNILIEVDEDVFLDFVLTDGCGLELITPIVVSLNEHPPFEILLPDSTEMCFGDLLSLQVDVSGGFGPHTIEWEHNASTSWSQSVSPADDRVYDFVVTDGCADVYFESVPVFVNRVHAAFDFDYWSDTQLSFSNLSAQHDSSYWSFGDGAESREENPVHTFDDLSNYTTVTLIVEDEIGCRDMATELIPPYMTAFVPNAFTPDNDGINEVFEFVLIGVQDFEFRVFNRWGEEVFFTNQIGDFWNGSHLGGGHYVPDGVYFWTLEMIGFESNTKRITGSVTILR